MSEQGLKDIDPGQLDSNSDQTMSHFDQMNLKDELLRGIYAYGFECPSAVQQRAIVPIIRGNNVLLEAPPATGKTDALCISALQLINTDIKDCQVLILTYSSYTARQTQKRLVDLGQYMPIDQPVSVGKRNAIQEDISALQGGQQVVVGSPGRVLELMQLGALTFEGIKVLVIDEADEVFAGFVEQVHATQWRMPLSVQVVFSSVTTPQNESEESSTVPDLLHIVVKHTGRPLTGIKQSYIAIEDENQKLDILSDLLQNSGNTTILIFRNLRRNLEWLAEQLQSRGIVCSYMQGDMTAIERAGIVRDFRSGSTCVLLATNMLARGLDLRPVEVQLVVNYDLPGKNEDYIHRTTYDSRFGRSGRTVSLVAADEVKRIRELERHYSTQIEETSVPLLMQSIPPVA